MAVVVDNQSQFADALAAAGAVERLDASLDEMKLAAALSALVRDAPRRREMSRRAAAICDGEGAARVAQTIGASISERTRKR
jgi:spore coat polysaccharide biosynthesis predicted glycosyltransferase SpsG